MKVVNLAEKSSSHLSEKNAYKEFPAGRTVKIAIRSRSMESLLMQFLSCCSNFTSFWVDGAIDSADMRGRLEISVVLVEYSLFLSDRRSAPVISAASNMQQRPAEIVFGNNLNESKKSDLLAAGARGFLALPKDIPLVVRAVNEVIAGGLWYERHILSGAILDKTQSNFRTVKGTLGHPIQNHLTKKEKIVSEMVSQGLRNREISDKLHISEKTVKLHLTHIYSKLNVSSRVQLALLLRGT